jgi:hypothetical protein
VRHRRLYAKSRKTARRCFRCDGLRPEPVSAAQRSRPRPQIRRSSHSGDLPRAQRLRRGQPAARARHAGAHRARHLSSLWLDRGGGAASLGNLSHDNRNRGVRLCALVTSDLAVQFRRCGGDAVGLPPHPYAVGRDLRGVCAGRSASSPWRSSSTPDAICGS